MLQKKLIQISNKIFNKKKYLIFFLAISSFFFTFKYGFIGIFPIDSFLIYDAGYKITNGFHPFKDYWSITGPILDYLQYVFFKFFGINWTSYVLHAASINLLVTIILFYFFLRIEINLFYSFIYSLSLSILAYPSIGTPFMDHHAVIFSTISAMYLFLAFKENKGHYWFFTTVFLAASFLSKQIPSAYLLIVFTIFIFLYFIFFSRNDFKFLIFLAAGSLFSLLLFSSFILINKIPFQNFLIQYIQFPFEIGKERSPEINFEFKNIFLQFKFLYFSIIPLFIVLFKLIKKKFNFEIKKDYFLLFYTLFVFGSFILGQLFTKNQILIFFLIPLFIGISHHFSYKYFNNKNLINIFLVFLLIFATIKFHLRFNENKKFMELENINLEIAVDAKNLHNSVKGVKWVTPYNNNPKKEIQNLNDVKKIISLDSSKKIIVSDYQILPSILNLKNTAPNKWFDSLSVPNRKNKFFKEYEAFFKNNLKNQKIETIYIYKIEKKKYLQEFLKNCEVDENVEKNILKIKVKSCL